MTLLSVLSKSSKSYLDLGNQKSILQNSSWQIKETHGQGGNRLHYGQTWKHAVHDSTFVSKFCKINLAATWNRPFAWPSHMVQNQPCWDASYTVDWSLNIQNKTTRTSPAWLFFVLGVLLCNLRSSMTDFVPCTGSCKGPLLRLPLSLKRKIRSFIQNTHALLCYET